jgi:hypothetical protein
MVGLEAEGTDEGTGTPWLDFRIALFVSWTPTANAFIGIALLTSGDDSAVVIVGTLFDVT